MRSQILSFRNVSQTSSDTLFPATNCIIEASEGFPPKVAKKGGLRNSLHDTNIQQKSLTRNRMAAKRCRQRRKTYLNNLQTREKAIVFTNLQLWHEFESLTKQVTHLKEILHTKCTCFTRELTFKMQDSLSKSSQPVLHAQHDCMFGDPPKGTFDDEQMVSFLDEEMVFESES